jgi:hypothetical protein
LTPRLAVALGVLAAVVVGVFLAGHTAGAVLVVAATCYLVASAFDRSYVAMRRMSGNSRATMPDPNWTLAEEALPDEALPPYTVVITALDESDDITRVFEHIARIDYPADKLEAILVLPTGAVNTKGPISAGIPMGNVRLISLPPWVSKTTAAACNYVMNLPDIRGVYLTALAVGDIPDPKQLRRAAQTFANAPTNVAALQAKLRCSGPKSGLFRRLRSMECDRWFSTRAPLVSRLGSVVPLAKSSFHIRTSLVREVGGWSPEHSHPETELSIRLARNGYRILLLDSYTTEAIDSRGLDSSNWCHGYLPVISTYARHPIQSIRELGLMPLLRIFDITVGRPLAYLTALTLGGLLGIQLVGGPGVLDPDFLQPIGAICLLLIVTTQGLAATISLAATRAE